MATTRGARRRPQPTVTAEPTAPLPAATRRRATAAGAEVGFPLSVFAVHWLLVQIPASLASLWGVPNAPSPPYGQLPAPLDGIFRVVVEPLRQWDGLWYALIADEGYAGGGIAKAAFWPLYPWLMAAGARLTGLPPEVVGYVVSNVAFAVALVLLDRLVRLDFDDGVARRALWAIALFPTALFFSAVYTESLFLALAVGALLSARTQRWWLAGLLGALAALTRSYGVLLILPFLLLLWNQARWDLRRWLPALPFAALPLLGPAIFGWHLNETVGNWRAFVDVQEQWNRYSAMPWQTLRCAIESCFAIGGEPDGATWGWLTNLLDHPRWGLRALPLWQSAYLLPGLLIPLFQPSSVHALMSMPRFGLTLFPLFVVLAIVLRGRVAAVAAVASSLLLALLSIQFALWYWVS